MQRLATHDIERLRAQIAQIEKRPVLAAPVADAVPLPESVTSLRDMVAASPGTLHEVFVDEQRQAGTGLGFTLGLSRPLLKGERRAILYLQLAKEAQELGLPYGLGLRHSGFDPESLVMARIETVAELLWAMEEAIACRAVAAVIADIGGHATELDFTATRRLSMRAGSAGTSAFMLRYGREREASAARLRWRVAPGPSGEKPFDAKAPGPPRFLVEIEKGKMGGRRLEGLRLVVDWTENEFVSVEPLAGGGAQLRTGTPVSGAFPAALGDRLSQAG